MSDHLFASAESFQHAFTSGLSGLLQKGGLGPFILVCANASFDQRVGAATAEGLKGLYEALSKEYVDALSSGKPIPAVEEDLLVFLKLHAVGFARLQATETRRAGPWEVQFNQLRSFRPRRITTQVPQTLHVPFDEASFHFNKPFMQKESFWTGKLSGRHATLYYNKYPFVDFHGLLVPERESCLPQFLTEAHHHYLWQATLDLSRTLHGAGFGYNSLGAFASVNHLHFQMFVKPEGLPVMAADWRHNGGNKPYPTHCATFDTPAAAWAYLGNLHHDNTPYNLLYSKNRLYVFPRRKQGCYAQPDWTSGFAWHEMAGGMITFNRESYVSLGPAAIAEELGKLAIQA
jgi:ATP adenylyltransferase/5',5'''-P-1,P-4-tetraphosphate phosphorylase II